MKKLNYLAIPILLILFVMAFTTRQVNLQPQIAKVHFNVIGCADCTQLHICLDGVPLPSPDSCSFTLSMPAGNHSLCIFCGSGNGGLFPFSVKDGSDMKFDVVMAALATGCNCDNNGIIKKK